MSHFDWDEDSLLNFDYGKPVPDGRPSAGQRNSDDAEVYAELRKKEQERARKEAQLREYMASARRAEERAQQEAKLRAQREAQLRAQQEEQLRAQQEAQLRAQREAQLRAQQEEQLRAQQEAQLRAQQEAQLRARIEAKLRAQKEEEIDLRTKQQVAKNCSDATLYQPSYGEPHAGNTLTDEQKAYAQKAAYERYRAQNRNEEKTGSEKEEQRIRKAADSDKKSRHKSDKSGKYAKKSKGAKILAALYVLAMVVFSVSMLVMNVLPLKYLILLYVVLVLLGVILITQLTGSRVKKWARGIAVFMTVILTFVYCVGTAYALGTLSFLGTTSVTNEDSVGKITEDPFNVVMTGIDVSGTIDEEGRSDVNMIVTVNPQTATILMTSIPRDYEVRLPDKGYATDKLTHTGFYGVETTILAEEDLFDIESNYYVKVNFSTVKNFINAIGGVDVYSEYTFNPVKMKSWTVQEGVNHMSGEQALAFARERKAFLTGDNQRIKNQQAVFEALIEKATSSKTMAISYGKILNELTDYFEMSFSSGEIRSLMKFQIAQGPEWKIYKSTVTGPGANKATYTGGSQQLYVMEQDPTSVANAKALINAVLEGRELQEDEDGNVTVVEAETE